jgi:multiple sugar transport system permease protein
MIEKIKYHLFDDQKKLIVFVAMSGFIIFNIIFFFIPLGYGIIGSFSNWNPLQGTMEFIGIENYISILSSSLFKISLKNTLVFSSSLIILRTGLGLIIAAGLYAMKKNDGILRSLYFLPVIMPIVAVSMVWEWVYHPRVGLLNMILAAFGIVGKNWLMDKTLAMPAVIFMTAWKDVGYAVVIFMAALMNIPRSLYEAANIDGANGYKSFRHITVPMLRPTIIFIVITSLISYFQSFVQIFVMTEGGPGTATYVISYMIYNEAFENYRFGYASALSVILFIIILLVTAIQLKVLSRGDES